MVVGTDGYTTATPSRHVAVRPPCVRRTSAWDSWANRRAVEAHCAASRALPMAMRRDADHAPITIRSRSTRDQLATAWRPGSHPVHIG